jgi:cysteine desulfurase/selenocysteine lyase
MNAVPSEKPKPEKFDPLRYRADFPLLARRVHDKPLIYFDNANTAQKPQAVIDAVDRYYSQFNANVSRAVHTLGEEATSAYEATRDKLARFINAPSRDEIVLTSGTTHAINTVAYSFAMPRLKAGDEILVTTMEHHANIVPWQLVCERTGARLKVAPITPAGELIASRFIEMLTPSVKLAAVVHVSNVLGTVNPVRDLAKVCRARGIPLLVDGSQAAPHLPIDVQALGCDFLAFSSHKLCGPSGVGALWGRRELLEAMEPFNLGGEMIRSVSLERTTFNELPHKFEAGTPAIAEAVGFGAAIDYVSEIGLPAIEQHEHELTVYALGRLGELEWVRLFGPPAERRAGIVSFEVAGVHPHDVAQILDWDGVCVRAGHHCTQPLMKRLGVTATTRASFYLYSVPEEIDRLVEGLQKVKKSLG